MHWHLVALGQFDRAGLQDLGPQAGQLEHLVVRDTPQLTGVRADARVSTVDPIHVGINLARLSLNGRGKGNRGGIRAPATKGRDVVLGIDPLKTSDYHDMPVPQGGQEPVGVDMFDPRPTEGAVRRNLHLMAEE